MNPLTPEQQEHVDQIGGDFIKLMTAKYVRGQQEHGGNLWTKKNLIDMAIDEAIDQVTYLMSIKRQLQEQGVVLGTIEEK